MDQDLEKEDGGAEGGGKQTRERSVNHVEQQATVVCFLSPFLDPNTLQTRPKTANNAAIQHVVSLLRGRRRAT